MNVELIFFVTNNDSYESLCMCTASCETLLLKNVTNKIFHVDVFLLSTEHDPLFICGFYNPNSSLLSVLINI